MSCYMLPGPSSYTLKSDNDGYRTYSVKFKVYSDSTYPYMDGPLTAARCPGLPQYGDIWSFGSEIDPWVWCYPEFDVAAAPEFKEGRPVFVWIITKTFSNKPLGKKCQDSEIQDPLLIPQKVSGKFNKVRIEATRDRFNEPIQNSAFEVIRGSEIEFDAGNPTIKIEQNVPLLEFNLVSALMHTVNDFYLWGFPPRCIKLSSFDWEKVYYGTCYYYYKRTFEFEVNTKAITVLDSVTNATIGAYIVSGWDKDLLDEGTKVVRGQWDKNPSSPTYKAYKPDPSATFSSLTNSYTNPKDFVRFQDWNGNYSKVILDGHGRPWDPDNLTTGTSDDNPGNNHVEYYQESNFFLLNIPSVI